MIASASSVKIQASYSMKIWRTDHLETGCCFITLLPDLVLLLHSYKYNFSSSFIIVLLASSSHECCGVNDGERKGEVEWLVCNLPYCNISSKRWTLSTSGLLCAPSLVPHCPFLLIFTTSLWEDCSCEWAHSCIKHP